MKKILSVLLAATMLVALFVLPSAAADNVNYGIEIVSTGTAPVVDGKIGPTEYGLLPVHTFSESKSQFDYTKNNEMDNWDFSFYATWDTTNLYLAWEVETEKHAKLPLAQFDSTGNPLPDTEFSEESLGYLWMHSCIQFALLPGEPKDGSTNFGANKLDIGFGQLADDSTGKAIWAYPNGVTKDDVGAWDAICVRDDANNKTIYEIAIPWAISGMTVTGEGSKFGLAYVVYAQEHYYNDAMGGIQWQTGCFYQEDVNKAGVVTLKEGEGGGGTISTGNKPYGDMPKDVEEKMLTDTIKFNSPIAGEDSTLLTDLDGDYSNAEGGYNFNYALTWALKPVGDDIYEITEVISNTGSAPEFTTLEKDSIIIAFHSDGTGAGNGLKTQAATYQVGTKIGLWGYDIDNNDTKYYNACIYVEEAVTNTPDDPNQDPANPGDEPTGATRPITAIDGIALDEGEVDGQVYLYPAGEEDRVILSDDVNLRYVYIFVFGADGKLVEVGNNLVKESASNAADFPQHSITVPAGGYAVSFYYNDSNTANQALKDVYDTVVAMYTDEGAVSNATVKVTSGDVVLQLDNAEAPTTVTVVDQTVPEVPDESSEVPSETPNTSEPTDNSKEESKGGDTATTESSEAEDEEGGNTVLIIVIVVVVVAAIAAAVVIILKKKKSA